MRRTRRRLTQLLSAVVLMVVGGVITLALYPLLPEGFKESVEDFGGKTTADFKFRNNAPIVDKRSPTKPPALAPTSTIARLTPTPTAIPLSTGVRISPTQRPTPSPTSRPIPTLTPTPTPTQVPLKEWQNYLLGLINADRVSFGLSPVTLGSNPAAQEHAEEMLEYSYLSHWDLDGLTPYMRYTLAGGVNYEAENASGLAFPLRDGPSYRTVNPFQQLRETEMGWMESPGHRKNILNPIHKKVNLGIACSRITCAAVQQFEGDYIEFNEPPTLNSGVLTLDATLLAGFTLSGIQVWYDQPPHPLTLKQLVRTQSYNVGETPVAFLRRPLSGNQNYLEDRTVFTWVSSISPYDVFEDTSIVSQKVVEVPWVTADVWQTGGGTFNVKANLAEVVREFGDGVYTIHIWSSVDGEGVPLTNYSIFLEAE